MCSTGRHALQSVSPAPNLTKGNPKDIKPWLDLLTINYGDDVEHILNWMAYKVQNPGEKINHALFLGGEQGIGKETILEPFAMRLVRTIA